MSHGGFDIFRGVLISNGLDTQYVIRTPSPHGAERPALKKSSRGLPGGRV